MNIVSKLFKSRDKPKDSTNGSGYRYHFGGTTSGNTVTERSADYSGAAEPPVRTFGAPRMITGYLAFSGSNP